jgi:hypothetical protein
LLEAVVAVADMVVAVVLAGIEQTSAERLLAVERQQKVYFP